MTPDSLRALIATGESLVLELKSDERTPFNDRDLVEAVGARTRPPVAVSVELVDVENKTVLVIEILVQRQPVATCDGVFLRRALGGDGRPACMPMDVYALQSLQADRGLLDPSSQVVDPLGRSRSARVRAFPAQRAGTPRSER